MFGRGRGLAGVGPQGGQFRPEGLVGAEQGLDRHGRGHLGGAQQPADVVAGQAEMAEHPVRAVGEGQAFLGFAGRAGPDRRRRGRGRPAPAAGPVDHLALHPMRARATWASGARSPLQPSEPCSRTTGVMPALSRPTRPWTSCGPNPGVPLGQGGGPQQHHGPDGFRFNLVAHGGGVGADQTDLQGGALVRGDVAVGQGAEAGRQPVDGLLPADQGGGDGIGPLRASTASSVTTT